MKNYIISFFALMLAIPVLGQTGQDKVILDAMQSELKRNKEQLVLPDMERPFYLAFSLGKSRQFEIAAVLGSVINSSISPWRSVGVSQVTLGDYNRTSDSRYEGQFPRIGLPSELNANTIRRGLWMAADATYKISLREMSGKEQFLKSNPLTPEEAALKDLLPVAPVTKIGDKKSFDIDQQYLEKVVRELSAIFKNYKNIFNSSVYIGGIESEIYKTTSEDVVLKQSQNFVTLTAVAYSKTSDGVRVGDNLVINAASPKDLPSLEELKKSVVSFADNFMKLCDAQQFEEYYSGPVLFEQGAAASLFINNLIQPTALLAYRKPLSTQPVKSLEDRMNKKVVDNRITIKNYSTLDKYNNVPLMGAYDIDADGVTPPKEITLVENGILKALLNGRIPTVKAPQSTGSSRFMLSTNDVAYCTAPGTIHVKANKGVKQEKMKKALIKAAKEEGLEYAYIVRKIAGPASLIYKVNVKNGDETLVRMADISRLDLTKLESMLAISSTEAVMNYAHNGQVLSSLIYPSSVLLGGVEINRANVKGKNDDSLTFPLLRE